MPDIPEAITAEIRYVDDLREKLRDEQKIESNNYHALIAEAARVRERILIRQQQLRTLKQRRRTLRFCVDAIEGRIIHLGTVEIDPEQIVVREVEMPDGLKRGDDTERVADAPTPPKAAPKESAPARMQQEKKTHPAKRRVLDTMQQINEPARASVISERIGLRSRQIAPVLASLHRDNKVRRLTDGRWTLR